MNNIAALPFFLGTFKSLEDILSTLKVDVVIEAGIIQPPNSPRLRKILEYWEREAERLKRRQNRDASDKRYREAIRNIEILNYELRNSNIHFPRGEYDVKRKVIKLYPDEMRQEYDGQCLYELLVSTFAHETMHAYFSRRGYDRYTPVVFVEEPLAEFGMLMFLNEVGSNYYQWAYDDVRNKKTFYRIGAFLMDQYIKEGSNSPTRHYLERYQIWLPPYTMLSQNNDGSISLPSPFPPIVIDGHRLMPHWENLFEYPPRYYFDERTGTLCLDGYWEERIDDGTNFIIDNQTHIFNNDQNVKNLYLGSHFYTDNIYSINPISICPVYVSPMNRYFSEIDNIPVYKIDNKPALPSCGKGLYEIGRNGKTGVIDENLNQVIPCIYDCVGVLDKNNLIRVSKYQKDGQLLYGLANLQGVEQVAVGYQSIRIDNNGNYSVRKNVEEYTIDKLGVRLK